MNASPRSHRPSGPDPLRLFLLDNFTEQRLRRIASADYDCDGDAIAREFRHNLDTGEYTYDGTGNPYECALMQRHDATSDRPLNELFGAWWMGTFCSDPVNFVLIDNLSSGGVKALLWMVLRGCSELGDLSRAAAHASVPFVRFVQKRDPFPESRVYDSVVGALEAIERHGDAGTRTARFEECREVLGADARE